MLIKRRDFLKSTSMATAALWTPRFLNELAMPQVLAPKGKIIVMLQLSGGNDGLNTVIPYRNDLYYSERPRIAIKRADSLSMTDEAGLHPALTALKGCYDQGELAVLNNVGYPNPDRSHFRSMDIWHTASPSNEYWNTGWLGRYLDTQCKGCDRPVSVLEIDDTLSLALKGATAKGIAAQRFEQLYQNARQPYFVDYHAAGHAHAHEAPVAYLYKTLGETLSSADYLYQQVKKTATTEVYPNSEMGKNLRTIASLILADTDTTVYYLSHGSFDTHINQEGQQQRLFAEMNAALQAFINEMKAHNRWKDVMVVTFSEFGRRVAQNASNGTDHGTANQMFFMSGGLRQKGLLNALPDLGQLVDGDLQYSVDFRQVYATLVERWLGASSKDIVPGAFEMMKFV